MLALDLVLEPDLLVFQGLQAVDVGAIGGPDQMGKHVHLAKGQLAQIFGCCTVGHQGPVGTWHIACLEAFRPGCLEFVSRFVSVEALDLRGVAGVQQFLERFRSGRGLARKADGHVVNLEVAGLAVDIGEAGHQLAQFACAQAGADQRTMKVVVELQQPRPSRCKPAFGQRSRLPEGVIDPVRSGW